jgi:hypothetical protein
MTATPAEAACGLRLLAAAIEARKLPPPAAHWHLVFRLGDLTGLDAAAASLGVTGGQVAIAAEEDGTPWLRLRGLVGGVGVELTADASARVLDPLTDEGAIVRTYAEVTS